MKKENKNLVKAGVGLSLFGYNAGGLVALGVANELFNDSKVFKPKKNKKGGKC
jgi:hypothetical protein